MTTIKTSELTGSALDWAVAKCEGVNEDSFHLFYEPTEPSDLDSHGFPEFHYSTVWSQGGPIIDRTKGFEFKHWLEARPESCCEAHIHNYDGDWIQFGPTPLIAAMRCYVASRLGDEVNVPEELT